MSDSSCWILAFLIVAHEVLRFPKSVEKGVMGLPNHYAHANLCAIARILMAIIRIRREFMAAS